MAEKIESSREGGIDAPTRHALDWTNPDFYNQDKIDEELYRTFEICHGCRRCVSLCDAYPTLFDLIDESPSYDIDTVEKSDYNKVVDECYMCDLCYQTKCPYVPPHPWALDFPHLMLRAKAKKFKDKKDGLQKRIRNKLLSSTDFTMKYGSIPLVDVTINTLNGSQIVRKPLEGLLGIHAKADLPKFKSNNLKKRVEKLTNSVDKVQANESTTGKVMVFGTCYCNFSVPEVGEDLFTVFRHNNIQTELMQQEKCCGMPKFELGDLESVKKAKEYNAPRFLKAINDGYDIVAAVPSCVLMFKQELPLMFPDDEGLQKIKSRIFDPFEYLSLRDKDGLLKKDFKKEFDKISYQAACHQRVQNIGPKTKEILSLIPGAEIDMIERCSGHDGTYAVKKESHETSIKIRKPVVGKVERFDPKTFTSDCPMAAKHVGNGVTTETETVLHPMSILKDAYGL
jgi:glycerol-3-phosphate dehydrogenase subunit C